jgi:rod shape-determining protein MreC
MLFNNGPLQQIWISKGAHAFMGNIWGMTQSISDYFSLKEANEKLARDNFELMTRVSRLEERLAEGGEFASLPERADTKRFRFRSESIVKISTGTQHNYFILDKGSTDGIIVGSGVITSKGAIGIIEAVSENYSYAISFQNHNLNISARLGKDGRYGPLSWDGKSSNRAILREIPHHLEIAPGDTVFSSGYSSIFPPDIPLGTIHSAEIVNGATYDIQVELFEDFGAIRYVSIVENIGKEEMNTLEQR